MTATATKSKKNKSTPFQSELRSKHPVQSTELSPSSTTSGLKEQERLSDWVHAS
jgi:hypothetical protein